jgi:phosphatidylserine/phosphatidylglycerophosphate/cardiolipin synthase-like enzyme
MNERDKTVFLDEEIEPQILAIIRDASEYVVIVTPYLDLWGHAQAAVGSAVKKGVKVTVVVRENQDLGKKGTDAVRWLYQNGVDLMSLDNLHAKIYMNEHTLLVSSMNMTAPSTNNSLEIALLVTNEHEQQQLRDYVNSRVIGMATSAREAIANANAQQPAGQPEVAVSHPGTGVCIRCGRPLYFDPAKPLCDDCYESWARYGDEEYEEHFCLRCGRPAEVTYARPLCLSCYRGAR